MNEGAEDEGSNPANHRFLPEEVGLSNHRGGGKANQLESNCGYHCVQKWDKRDKFRKIFQCQVDELLLFKINCFC